MGDFITYEKSCGQNVDLIITDTKITVFLHRSFENEKNE